MWGTDAHLAPSRPDAILRYADHPRGFAELRIPEGEGPFPLALIFHGGCFKYGVADQAYMAPLATAWQNQGVATLNVDYREVGDGGGWPGSFDDWVAAARLIDTVAGRFPIDVDRVTLVGHSAGALPALWLAEPQGADAPGGARAPVRARAALILDGPGDLGRERDAFDALCEFSSISPFMGSRFGTLPLGFAVRTRSPPRAGIVRQRRLACAAWRCRRGHQARRRANDGARQAGERPFFHGHSRHAGFRRAEAGCAAAIEGGVSGCGRQLRFAPRSTVAGRQHRRI